MNQKLRELARMSGFTVDETGTFTEFAEKTRLDCFAELIVQDTIKLLQQEWYDLNNAPPVEGESVRDVGIRVGRKSEVIALMSKVSKHFGVEE